MIINCNFHHFQGILGTTIAYLLQSLDNVTLMFYFDGLVLFFFPAGIQFVISECKRVGESALKVKKLHTSIIYDIKRGALSFRVPLLTDVQVQGDVKVEFFKHKLKKVFRYFFTIFMIHFTENYFSFLS